MERIFFGIFNDIPRGNIRLFAEGYREHLSDRSKEKEYMLSMLEDLKKIRRTLEGQLSITKY